MPGLTTGVAQATETKYQMLSSVIGGSFGGYVCFPWEGLKKKMQSGEIQRISFKEIPNLYTQHLCPRELFRGSISFANSVMLNTVAVKTAERGLQALPGYDAKSVIHQGAVGIGSGMIGAFCASAPVENIVLEQQRLRSGPVQAVRSLFRQGIARPWVGLPELMVREAGFALVMLKAGQAANQAISDLSGNKTVGYCAELGVCVMGALVTHPFDVLATRKQKANGALTSSQAVRQVLDLWGVQGFWKGGAQRCVLFTGCAVIIPRATAVVSGFLNKK